MGRRHNKKKRTKVDSFSSQQAGFLAHMASNLQIPPEEVMDLVIEYLVKSSPRDFEFWASHMINHAVANLPDFIDYANSKYPGSYSKSEIVDESSDSSDVFKTYSFEPSK